MAKVCPNHEGTVRRSARKRRSPGEWWQAFSGDEEKIRAATVRSQQGNSPGRKAKESISLTRPESPQSIFSEQPLPSHRIPGGENKDPHVDPSRKRRLLRHKSANEDGKAPNESDREDVASGTGKEKITQNRPEECHVSIDNCDMQRKEQPTPDRNQVHASDPSGSNSYSRTTNPCSTPRHSGTFSDKSTLTAAKRGSFPVPLQTNTDEAQPLKSLTEQRDEERDADVDISRMETDQEMRWERNQLEDTSTMNPNRSRQRMDENDGMEGNGKKKTFASARVLIARENDKENLEKGTPLPSNSLFPKDPTDEVSRRHRYFSKLRAPRKNRSKPNSPSYSFSLRSRHESPDFLASVQRLSRNQQASGELKRNRARYMQQKALVAKRSTLMYSSVDSYVGTMKVAISISLNKSTMGEVVLLPRSATGPRRALTGDEFYIVKQGYVECDVEFTSVTLFAGDHLGIPAGQSFEMRNPSASKSELFFFSPRGTLN